MCSKGKTISLLVFLVSQFGTGTTFRTKNCDQNQLEVKTMGTLKCLNNHWKEVEGLFHPNQIQNTLQNKLLGCDYIDRDVACYVDHIGSCFPEAFKNDVATLLDAYLARQDYMSCDRHGVSRTARFELINQRITRKYEQYPSHPALMDSIIQLDHMCDEQTLTKTLQKDSQCFMTNANPSFQKAAEGFILASQFYGQSMSWSKSMPVCKGVTEALKCFNVNGCLTDQERQYVENLVATLYKVVMKELVRIQNDFGGISELFNLLGIETTPVFMDDASDELALYDVILEMVTEDYQSPTCTQSLQAWKDCTKDCKYGGPSNNPTIEIVN